MGKQASRTMAHAQAIRFWRGGAFVLLLIDSNICLHRLVVRYFKQQKMSTDVNGTISALSMNLYAKYSLLSIFLKKTYYNFNYRQYDFVCIHYYSEQ
jgi:hypothetical protein